MFNSFFRLLFAFSFIIALDSCKEEAVNIDDPKETTCRNSPTEKYATCVQEIDTTSLDIATWNIKFFPSKNTTAGVVKDMVNSFNADIIAVQEIELVAEMYKIIDELEDWDVQIMNTGSLNLGFIYNTCEITSVSDLKVLNIGDSYIFPRFPIELTITHKNGMEATLINIHLKCCDRYPSDYQRRADASAALKEYIDNTYPDRNVVLLGDYNDEITEAGNPFLNFINDTGNYIFTDMAIASGPESGWSYPEWPSHIDHILVTNELFDNVSDTRVVMFEDCYSHYANGVSDHRPVILSLIAE